MAKKASLIKKLESLGSDNIVVLFFGTQTGTAEDFAARIKKHLVTSLGIKAISCDVDEYDMQELEEWPRLISAGKKWACGFFMAT